MAPEDDGPQKDEAPTFPEAFVRQSVSSGNGLLIGDSQYTDADPSMSPAAIRKAIVKNLDGKTFMIQGLPLVQSDLEDVMDELGPVASPAVHSGMVWANCYYDGTDNTGIIESGKPIVYDSVTGRGVTGINENWGVGEYKVVGTAWQSFGEAPTDDSEGETGWGKIPVTLERPLPATPGPKQAIFYNNTYPPVVIPAYAVMQVEGAYPKNGQEMLACTQYGSGSSIWPDFAVNLGEDIQPGDTGFCYYSEFVTDFPIQALWDTTEPCPPYPGERWGVVPGTWMLGRDYEGYIAVSYTAGDELAQDLAPGTVFVRRKVTDGICIIYNSSSYDAPGYSAMAVDNNGSFYPYGASATGIVSTTNEPQAPGSKPFFQCSRPARPNWSDTSTYSTIIANRVIIATGRAIIPSNRSGIGYCKPPYQLMWDATTIPNYFSPNNEIQSNQDWGPGHNTFMLVYGSAGFVPILCLSDPGVLIGPGNTTTTAPALFAERPVPDMAIIEGTIPNTAHTNQVLATTSATILELYGILSENTGSGGNPITPGAFNIAWDNSNNYAVLTRNGIYLVILEVEITSQNGTITSSGPPGDLIISTSIITSQLVFGGGAASLQPTPLIINNTVTGFQTKASGGYTAAIVCGSRSVGTAFVIGKVGGTIAVQSTFGGGLSSFPGVAAYQPAIQARLKLIKIDQR